MITIYDDYYLSLTNEKQYHFIAQVLLHFLR